MLRDILALIEAAKKRFIDSLNINSYQTIWLNDTCYVANSQGVFAKLVNDQHTFLSAEDVRICQEHDMTVLTYTGVDS